jgi:hypothetical protein
MHQTTTIAYIVSVVTLVVCAACSSHKKPATRQQPVEHQYENNILQQVRAQVEGVECAGCVEDVLAQLKKIPGVQMAVFNGRYDVCEQGYFSFYFPSADTFDVAALNAKLAADGFCMKLI